MKSSDGLMILNPFYINESFGTALPASCPASLMDAKDPAHPVEIRRCSHPMRAAKNVRGLTILFWKIH